MMNTGNYSSVWDAPYYQIYFLAWRINYVILLCLIGKLQISWYRILGFILLKITANMI